DVVEVIGGHGFQRPARRVWVAVEEAELAQPSNPLGDAVGPPFYQSGIEPLERLEAGPQDDEEAAIADDRPRRFVLVARYRVGYRATDFVDLGHVAAKGVNGFLADAVGPHPPSQVADPGQVPVADLAESAPFQEAPLSELAHGLQLPIAGAQFGRRRHHH